MFEDPEGPIQHFEWGRFTINGAVHGDGTGVGKDIRLVGNDVSAWDERRGHELSGGMITGVYNRGVEVLIVGNGVYGRLQCPDEVIEEIRADGIADVRVLPTPDACREYNRLYHAGRRAALLAHGTC